MDYVCIIMLNVQIATRMVCRVVQSSTRTVRLYPEVGHGAGFLLAQLPRDARAIVELVDIFLLQHNYQNN